MFEQLFVQRRALARHISGPLSDERRRFLAHLADNGLPRSSLRYVAALLLQVVDTLRLEHRPGESISRDEINRKATDRRFKFVSVATRWLHFLGRLKQEEAPANPYGETVGTYAYYLKHERGISAGTLRNCSRFLRQFLLQLDMPIGPGCEVTLTQIENAFQQVVNAGKYTPRSVNNMASDLRGFLRYAEKQGWCRTGLAGAIKGPRTSTQQSLPIGPSWDDVRRLLATTEGDRPVDIRDRAILMLLAIYGLRGGKVGHLRLDDFDWEQELVSVVCPKTRRTRIYPLIRSVGDAVLRYLKEVRPRSPHREVFLTILHPIRPLYHSMSGAVRFRLRRLGVSRPHYGTHALRHACAAHMLAQGMSLKEIGDHLGHRRPDTTRIYAKVDLIGLHKVADFDLGGLQ